MNETEIEEMLADAEKFAAADKQTREDIDLKNEAETLCSETERDLSLFEANITEEKQQKISKLIENIRQDLQSDNINSLKLNVKDLKTEISDMLTSELPLDNKSDPFSKLRDLL